MCGRAAIAYAAPDIGRAVRTAGVTLPQTAPPPAEYSASKACKGAKDKDGKLCGTTYPVLQISGGELTVRTKEWGMRSLSTHNVWCDSEKWISTKTWRQCLESGRRCAVCVTAFAEGITCRQSDDGLFFLAALYVGDAFVVLTTDSTQVPLLAQRATAQAGHGVPTRCPLWMDAEGATRWLCDEEAASPAGALAAVRRLEGMVCANQPPLVQGAAPRAKAEAAAKPDARQRSLASFVRKSGPAPAPAPAHAPAPVPPTSKATPPTPTNAVTSVAGAKRAAPRACPACTLETDDEARVCCEACGCELDPLPPAKRNKPGAEGAQATPRRRSIESFFEKKS